MPAHQDIIKDIALLHSKPTKQLLFFAYMTEFMGPDNIAHMTPNIKKLIIERIGTQDNRLHAANHNLSRLVARGLIEKLGGGAYKVIPDIRVNSAKRGESRELCVYYGPDGGRDASGVWL
jgi:hypothetical protein